MAENGDLPEVLVLAPDLKVVTGERTLPHVYPDVDGLVSLCLFWGKDWSPTKLAAKTLVPWTADWFWFFEHWLHTGTWLGGGTHPELNQRPAVAI